MNVEDLQIKERRKALGLSQAQLAANAGISLPTLQNLENKKSQNPSLDVLNRLATQLGLKLTATSTTPNWDFLSACGVPILAQSQRNYSWDTSRLSVELRLGLQELASAPNLRYEKAILAFASALAGHYPKFVKQNHFEFLILHLKNSKIELNQFLKYNNVNHTIN
jgi:transcriptional regulator with XRE-family HTH domain